MSTTFNQSASRNVVFNVSDL